MTPVLNQKVILSHLILQNQNRPFKVKETLQTYENSLIIILFSKDIFKNTPQPQTF